MLRRCFEKWRLPFMKEDIRDLCMDEKEIYKKVTAQFNAKISSRKFENDATRDYMIPMLEGRYIEQFEEINYKNTYLKIIDVCDNTCDNIKELYDKSQIPSEIESKYRNLKEISDKETNNKKDYYYLEEITMPIIKILHTEYVNFLDYQRLIKLKEKASLTEEESISIAYYLMRKNLISFYLKMDKYPENTLIVKKVMNRFSKKNHIRPEDSLEVFEEYIGNGEESKRIMDHETPIFWGDLFLNLPN